MGGRIREAHTACPTRTGHYQEEIRYAMSTLRRIYGQGLFFGRHERQRRDGFQWLALSELWRHHGSCYCASSLCERAGGSETQTALVRTSPSCLLPRREGRRQLLRTHS